MADNIRVLRRRIRSVRSTKKITRAMELIAASRIAKAQAKVAASRPYADGITKVIAAVQSQSTVAHPLTTPRENSRSAAVLLISSDRGLAGAYSSTAIKTGEQLVERLRGEGKEVHLYGVGRKAVGYFRFRNRPLQASYTGFSEQPSYADAKKAADQLIEAFLLGSEGAEGTDAVGVDEIWVVFTEFRSMVSRAAVATRILPLDVADLGLDVQESKGPQALYEFEPSPEGVLDALLPRYVESRVYAALLDSAASESAARRAAMKSASDNADELIKALTRRANQARQAVITQEIAEIVGGANALSDAA